LTVDYIVKVKLSPDLLKLMNSSSLKQNGFAPFVPLKSLHFSDVPSNKCSVLILADSTISDKPTSDILFIGRSKKPSKRVFGGYLAGYGGKITRKISSKLLDDGYIEKVSISWMETDSPKAAQQELLESFKKEHGEYPVWNVSQKSPVKPQPTVKAVKAQPARKPAKPAASP
jgi:hypothetical protein